MKEIIIKSGQILKGPLFNKSIEKWIAGYDWLEIDALTLPMQVCKESLPYGDREKL
jgi:hypothetical protein